MFTQAEMPQRLLHAGLGVSLVLCKVRLQSMQVAPQIRKALTILSHLALGHAEAYPRIGLYRVDLLVFECYRMCITMTTTLPSAAVCNIAIAECAGVIPVHRKAL